MLFLNTQVPEQSRLALTLMDEPLVFRIVCEHGGERRKKSTTESHSNGYCSLPSKRQEIGAPRVHGDRKVVGKCADLFKGLAASLPISQSFPHKTGRSAIHPPMIDAVSVSHVRMIANDAVGPTRRQESYLGLRESAS
jgi:hypothetical protein